MKPDASGGRWDLLFAVLVILAALANPTRADLPRVELERPVRLVVRTIDDHSISGQLVGYDGQAMEMRQADDQITRVAWADVPTRRAYAILSSLLESGGAEAWMQLGAMMLVRTDGEPFADRAFARAVHLEPSIRGRIERLRRGEPADQDPPTPPKAAGGGPEMIGPIEANFWGPLSDAQQAAAIDQLNAFARQGMTRIGIEMRLIETKYFLFYTDLKSSEAKKWAGLLDRMYDRLCDLFGIERGVNIWRGKCLIFVFAREADFHRFEAEVHGKPSQGQAAGRCWSYGSGVVHVTFYRQPQESRFAHVLVHETVHGFLHRYRSPMRIASVWNEGLAEVIAMELVPQDNTVPWRQAGATAELKRRGDLGTLFHDQQIEGWHYGLASSLTAMMIRENKRGYVAFINGIKDGTPWRESLERNYGVSLNRLVAYFGEQHGVRGLRP